MILTVHSIIFGVLYWYVWTRLIPHWKGYSLEEAVEVLDDGTSITKLVQVPKGFKPAPITDEPGHS